MRREDADQSVKEGGAPVLKQCLRRTHAARRTRGENNASRPHRTCIRSLSLAYTDFESCFQELSGLRLIAIISATTETAISSGVIAPISNPIGAKIRSNAAAGIP